MSGREASTWLVLPKRLVYFNCCRTFSPIRRHSVNQLVPQATLPVLPQNIKCFPRDVVSFAHKVNASSASHVFSTPNSWKMLIEKMRNIFIVIAKWKINEDKM